MKTIIWCHIICGKHHIDQQISCVKNKKLNDVNMIYNKQKPLK